jgi:hypothetical protein
MRAFIGGIIFTVFVLFGFVCLKSNSFVNTLEKASSVAAAQKSRQRNLKTDNISQTKYVQAGYTENREAIPYISNPHGYTLRMPKNPFGPRLRLRDKGADPFKNWSMRRKSTEPNTASIKANQPADNNQLQNSNMTLPGSLKLFKGYVNMLEDQMKDDR